LIQVAAFILTCLKATGQLGHRFTAEGFNLPNIIFVHLSESLIGTRYLKVFDYFGLDLRVLAVILIVLELYMSYLLIKSFFFRQTQLPGIAFILLTIPAILLSERMYSSPRGAFAPAIILTVLMIYECGNTRNRLFSRVVAMSALSAVMLFGLLMHDMKGYCSDYLPVWKNEVLLWRQDKSHLLRIHPRYEFNSWNIKLDSKKE
jgi:hypothetical protein